MEFEVVDLSNVTADELIHAINNNIRTAKLMSSEIAKLKASSKVKRRKDESDSSFAILEESCTTESVDSDFEDEVDYYFQLLRSYNINNLDENIAHILPSKMNYNYKRILLRLKAEVIKKIKDIKDFIGNEHLSLEDASVFSDDLAYERKCLDLIDLYLEEKNEEELDVSENKFVFFASPSGNIHVFDSLEGIDSAFYSRFYELFQSIKNGTFKGVKRFNNNGALNGLCEVKGTLVRVIYSRLSSDCYAIITAFVKKTDKDSGYSNFLAKHCRDFKNIEDVLKSKLDDEKFMRLNKEYEDELFRMLSEKDKRKPLVKERGDISE